MEPTVDTIIQPHPDAEVSIVPDPVQPEPKEPEPQVTFAEPPCCPVPQVTFAEPPCCPVPPPFDGVSPDETILIAATAFALGVTVAVLLSFAFSHRRE